MAERLIAAMAPLFVKDSEFPQFERRLNEAQQIGVEAITVDVWWGHAERTEGHFDWDYYSHVFEKIVERDMAVVPIMSFHRGGGGPSDGDIDISLPDWHLAPMHGVGDDLYYESETGYRSRDAIPPWVSEEFPKVIEWKTRFLDAFLRHFKSYLEAGKFPEVNISLGPTGELRYPSYMDDYTRAGVEVKRDGWVYPHRGYFQCYCQSAQRSFLRWVKTRGPAWAAKYADNEIRVPNGHLVPNGSSRADTFVEEKQHLREGYPNDFLQWYHECLLAHAKRDLAAMVSKAQMTCHELSVPAPALGLKIPGIHWQWRCTDIPRYAEITAGLVPPQTAHDGSRGYEGIFAAVAAVSKECRHPLRVHFTALEMDDDTCACSQEDAGARTSMAHTLVRIVGECASGAQVYLAGENALPYVDAEDSSADVRTWDYIRSSFDWGYFSGFALLRLDAAWDTDKAELKRFIADYDIDESGPVPRVVSVQHS